MASASDARRPGPDDVEEEKRLRTVSIHLRAKDVPLKPVRHWAGVHQSVSALNQMSMSDFV